MNLSIAHGALVVGASLLVGCFGPIPHEKATLDQQVAQLRPTADRFATPRSATLLPIKIGQWIQFKTIDSKGAVSLTTTKIVAQEGTAFWQESVTQTYSGRGDIKALVNFGDLNDPSSKKILKIIIRDGKGREQEYSAGAVEFMQGLVPLVHLGSGTKGPQEDVQVLAGRFAGCFKNPITIKTVLGTATGTSWWHPAVPLGGIVRSIIDTGLLVGTTELVAFGETLAAGGGKSSGGGSTDPYGLPQPLRE